jgi:hypothetical protein
MIGEPVTIRNSPVSLKYVLTFSLSRGAFITDEIQ